MRAYSYVVARDYGFAPNPFFGSCTLATCKPVIRKLASPGDWVFGTGAKTRYNRQGHLLFAMLVSEAMTYEDYWKDPRFLAKRPVPNGSVKQLYGDNIYSRRGGRWVQADSHHSLSDGRANGANVTHDTNVNRILIAERFVYYGRNALKIPQPLRDFGKEHEDVCCAARGHRIASPKLADALIRWLEARGAWGLQGVPLEFATQRRL